MAPGPVDPASSAPLALSGRVVTMDDHATVHDSAVLYAREGAIVDILPPSAPPPPGFEDVPVTPTRGTMYPGLIELHNHLPYDVLGLWPVPKRYDDRDQWSHVAAYKKQISGPMRVLGSDPDLVAAIVRYVEVRALLGGTTTSQGIALAKSNGIIGHFRGLVRNVESTGEATLPPAGTHIPDIVAVDAEKFLARISGRKKWILHLSEGADTHAHDAFEALHLGDGRWAITPNLIGIHCVALTAGDFETFAGHGGSMVWSPLSNLLLYGRTADIGAAMAAKVPIALGSDWAPSGSKNLLGEIKVARIVADVAGVAVTDHDLVAMATRTPASMLGWGERLGTLEKSKLADLIVLGGATGDPYARLLAATEADLRLVVINGIPRMATPALMTSLAPGAVTEPVSVAGRRRALNLAQDTADPTVEAVSVAEAISRLEEGLASLTEPAAHTAALRRAGGTGLAGVTSGTPTTVHVDLAQRAAITAANAFREGRSLLAAAQLVDNHESPRPHLPLRGRLTGPNLDHLELPTSRRSALGARRAPVATLQPAPIDPSPALALDPLTAVDNPQYYSTQLATNTNLPAEVRSRLVALAP